MKIEHLLGLATVCYNESKQLLSLSKVPSKQKVLKIYSVGRRLQPILLHVIFMTENSDQSITPPFNYFGKNVIGVTPKMTKDPPI